MRLQKKDLASSVFISYALDSVCVTFADLEE